MRYTSLFVTSLLVVLCHSTIVASSSSDDEKSQNKPDPINAKSPAGWVFAYFRENGEDGLHLAWSRDGLKWTPLRNDGSFSKPEVGGKIMRDPCIIQGPDGIFHMVWTSSWRNAGIGIAHSTDLIHWSPQEFVPVMEHEKTAKNCWAPEITWDPNNREYIIYWATTIPEKFQETEAAADKGWNHRLYCTTTKDFKTYSDARLFYEPGFNCIDATLVEEGANWLMLLKDETLTPPAKNLRIAKSAKASGPYSAASPPFTPAGVWVEGPTCARIGDAWYVYFDKYQDGAYGAMKTRDFINWEDVSAQLVYPKGMRHGTVLPVSGEVLDRLLKLDAKSPPELKFSAAGTPETFVVREAEGNLVQSSNPGKGFFLSVFNNASVKEVPLNNVVMKDGQLIVSTSKGLPRFTFDVTQGKNYLAFKLKRVEGLPDSGGLSLHFDMNCQKDIRVLPLDHMINAGTRGTRTVDVDWNYLWHLNSQDPLGGFAIYGLDSDERNDDALAEIWVNEDLPKPKISEPWTPERVRRWVNDYAQRFQDLTTIIISAGTPEELKKLTDYAQAAGAKVVYLHTDTWRGEYWPQKRTHVDVNPKVFPGGRADLKRYAEDLHRRGMLLSLHYVSGGIGNSDPKRILGKVDRRLASWGGGQLAEAIDDKTTTIRFKPSAGTHLPLTVPHMSGKDLVGQFMNPNCIRIEDEIVEVGTFEDLDQPVWTLKDCRRGRGGTPVTPHPAGAESAGLLSAYGQNYMPDLDSSLLEEMANEFAAFANEIGLDHLEYDGYEIHAQYPWGSKKFSDAVARALDHPVTSNTSGGRPVASNLEMLFSKVRKINQFGYSSVNLALLLDGHRPATSLQEANFDLQAGVASGAKRFVIQKPEPMFGVSVETLQNHGLVQPMLATFQNWKRASELLTDQQRQILAKSVEPVKSRLRQAGNHVQSRDVYCITDSDGKLELTPTRVMVRREGDAPWLIGQEFGPSGPWQFCQPGDVLEVENPFKPQPAGFVIHVLPELGGSAQSGTPAAATASKDSAIVDSYRTGAEAAYKGDLNVQGPVNKEMDLQPKASEIKNQKFTKFAQDGNALVLSATNPTGEAIWIENDLAGFGRNFSMESTRGIAMEITGDNSGAVLVVQPKGRGTRDYVVKINFTGRKTIIIPNGEAAWSNGWWGWRMDSKFFDYGKCGRVELGFGYIPPGSQPKIKLENLRLLPSQPSRLVNPVIHTGAGQVQINGEIETGQYLEYDGKKTARVYDKNWNQLKELKATAIDYVMPKGYAPVKVEVSPDSPRPWLAVRYIVKGEPMIVK